MRRPSTGASGAEPITAEMLDHMRNEVRRLVLADPATGHEVGMDEKPPG